MSVVFHLIVPILQLSSSFCVCLPVLLPLSACLCVCLCPLVSLFVCLYCFLCLSFCFCCSTYFCVCFSTCYSGLFSSLSSSDFYLVRAVICQKQISVEGDGHCCHRPSSNWETNQLSFAAFHSCVVNFETIGSPGSRLLDQLVPASYLHLQDVVVKVAEERKQEQKDPVLYGGQYKWVL